jgi:hypothetical protein
VLGHYIDTGVKRVKLMLMSPEDEEEGPETPTKPKTPTKTSSRIKGETQASSATSNSEFVYLSSNIFRLFIVAQGEHNAQ